MPEKRDFFGEGSYFGEGGHLDRQRSGASSGQPSGGGCGDCGGTGDCIHCSGGYYPKPGGKSAPCGKCRGRGNRKHPYMCHACRGRGYGGQKCGTPTYEEAKAISKRAAKQGKESYGQGSGSGVYGRSSYSRMKGGTFDGYPSLSRRRDDGALDIFYGPEPIDPDDARHGHAIIKTANWFTIVDQMKARQLSISWEVRTRPELCRKTGSKIATNLYFGYV